ncbi:MAG: hypothetical protein R3E97_14120 [Candidatus Eisenbacteria bacterium]
MELRRIGPGVEAHPAMVEDDGRPVLDIGATRDPEDWREDEDDLR